MAKKNKGKEKRNSVSETKISDQKLLREKIISIVNRKYNNNKSEYLLFYLIKLFEQRKYKPISKEEIIQTIKNKYSENPKYFITNTKEHFKTKQSISSTLIRIFNKICSKKNNFYKLNEKATLKYLKNNLTNEENTSAKTPYKLYNRKPQIKKEKNQEEEIKIKLENINIKEEQEDDYLNQENKIKEEKKENDYFENMSIEIEEEEEKKEMDLFELFNQKKLYDDFYLYLAEEGQFEQLQEVVENFMEKYNNDKIEESNKFKILGIIGKIVNVKNLLDKLYKSKKDYEKLSSDLEQKKIRIKFFVEIFYVNIKTIKNMQSLSNLNELITEAKNLYKEDKKKQNIIFDNIINNIKSIRNVVMNSDKIKNDIIKEIEIIAEYFKKNNINTENKNEFYDVVNNLINGKYSFIIREDISEDIIEKYNKCINVLEESLNLDNNLL